MNMTDHEVWFVCSLFGAVMVIILDITGLNDWLIGWWFDGKKTR